MYILRDRKRKGRADLYAETARGLHMFGVVIYTQSVMVSRSGGLTQPIPHHQGNLSAPPVTACLH